MSGGLPGLFRRGTGSRRISLPRGRGSLLLTVLLVLGLYFLGVDPRILLQSGGLSPAPGQGSSQFGGQAGSSTPSPEQSQLADFVSVVLADTEDTWHPLFRQMELTYKEPKLVLFSGVVQSACGMGQSAMGPFYCPPDEKLYIDLSFYEDLKNRHGAPGDFAQAYVIAHEIGHHVQNLLGISDKVASAGRDLSKAERNRLSVRLELQADCFAGVWGYHADRSRQILEKGDIEEALTAASSIGDDRLQRQTRGQVAPESFTHGTSKQRVRWFRRGIEHGDPELCNTFEAERV
jgi:predicted metalloprotease